MRDLASFRGREKVRSEYSSTPTEHQSHCRTAHCLQTTEPFGGEYPAHCGRHGAQYLIVHPSKGHVCSGRNAGGKNRCQQVACRAISAELDGLLWGTSRVVDGGILWCSFERGCDAHASSDNLGGHDDPGGRPGHGSTLRSPVSGLLPEVGGGRLHRHRLQLYIIGSVQDDGVGTLSYVLRQPILAANTSGIAGRRPSATRPRLLGHGCCETRQATGQ